AVDEGAVGRAEILDEDLVVGGRDLRVLARDHVLDEDHVEIARPPDDDLAVLPQGELSPLVLPGDEAKGEHGLVDSRQDGCRQLAILRTRPGEGKQPAGRGRRATAQRGALRRSGTGIASSVSGASGAGARRTAWMRR